MNSRALLILIYISGSSSALVKWLPNKSFNIPDNYRNKKIPCSKQTVVFPDKTYESVSITTDTFISGLVLPKFGEIILDNAGFVFGGDSNTECDREGNAYYEPMRSSSWAQANVWSSSKYNEATPDAERVPCFDDKVEFPSNSEFFVLLPQKDQYIQDMKFWGLPFGAITTTSLKGIVKYNLFNVLGPHQSQIFALNDYSDTGVVIVDEDCKSRAGCQCQKNVLKIDCSVKFCPQTICVNPIKPVGHCCDICGGLLTINIDDEKFDVKAFEETVVGVVKAYGEDKVAYHIGRIPENKTQLIVVEKGEYTGISQEIVHAVEMKIYNEGFKTLASYSGSRLKDAGMAGKIAVSVLFIVLGVMGSIYLYYYKIPEIRYPNMSWRIGREVISRFNRRTDSVVSLTSTRRDSGVVIGSSSNTAFRNPMYDSRRGRVQVVDTVEEEQ